MSGSDVWPGCNRLNLVRIGIFVFPRCLVYYRRLVYRNLKVPTCFFCNVPSTYIDFSLHGNLFQLLSIPTKIHENPFSRRGNLKIVCMYFCHRLLPKEKVKDGDGGVCIESEPCLTGSLETPRN
jgi:hypothetical protein